jgi:hypothetical protein
MIMNQMSEEERQRWLEFMAAATAEKDQRFKQPQPIPTQIRYPIGYGGACPHCGYCPHCGRGGTQPLYPHYYGTGNL